MNKRKEPTSKEPGIDRFFPKSQRTDGNEEAHKTASQGSRQIPGITASSTASTSAAHGHPVEPSIMLQRVKKNFPSLEMVKHFILITTVMERDVQCTTITYHSVLSAFFILKIAFPGVSCSKNFWGGGGCPQTPLDAQTLLGLQNVATYLTATGDNYMQRLLQNLMTALRCSYQGTFTVVIYMQKFQHADWPRQAF